MEKSKILNIFKARVAYHIYFWGFLFCVSVVESRTQEITFLNVVIESLKTIIRALPPVYLHFYIFEKTFSKRRYGWYALLLIILITAWGMTDSLLISRILDFPEPTIGSIFFVISFIMITTMLKLAKAGFEQRMTLQEIQSKHLQTELELLKTQINPHFLFNTLNNLFGMARRQDKATADGISRLSHLMRYMIYDSNVEKIDLKMEVNQIQRLIELQKLRFTKEDDITIDFQIVGELNVQIPPMLLLPFIENAFKHGISLENPSFIKIQLEVLESTLRFSVKNTNHTSKGKTEKSIPGMGLRNVKRRLELLFPGIHELTVQKTDQEWDVELTLHL